MSEWATLRPNHGLRNAKISWETILLPLFLGGLLARGSIIDMYPFGIAFGAALILNGERNFFYGLGSIAIGFASIGWAEFIVYVPILLALTALLPLFRKNRFSYVYLGTVTAGLMSIGQFIAQRGTGSGILLTSALEGALAGGLAIVFYYALSQRNALWSGEFSKEQGLAWLVLLTGVLGGLKGVYISEISFSVVVLTFFILFVAQRFGSGAAAGVGAALGFLPELAMSSHNLMSAGVYGLAGFCTGAFQRFGKLGIGGAYFSVMLIISLSFQPSAAFSQLISSALGLSIFLLWPGLTPKPEFLSPKKIPEVETAVSKVKTLAEIFEQMAVSHQAAELEDPKQEKPTNRSELPELMNVLADRVCKSCPTFEVCWDREFYQTYHFLLSLFATVESRDVEAADLPLEWKRHCGRIKEMLLGVQFIIEQERNQEVWRKRLEENREALSYQYESVSQVIGNLAKELHSRHNWEEVRAESLARRRRSFLDVGVVCLSKSSGDICGDNYASLAFSPDQHVFVLSDGMGVGEGAAKMSSTALTLLEQLLTTGFEPARAVQALNSILVLRSPEEGFVTLDMGIMDLDSDHVSLIKLGASPSYLKTPKGVELFTSSSLPVGILNHIEIPVIELEMRAGDALILVTDGIHDILKTGEEWIQGFIEKVDFVKSQDLANAVGEEARRLCGKELPDDGVVLVVRKKQWQEQGKEH